MRVSLTRWSARCIIFSLVCLGVVFSVWVARQADSDIAVDESLPLSDVRSDTSGVSFNAATETTMVPDPAPRVSAARLHSQSNAFVAAADGSIYPETARLASLSTAVLVRQIRDPNPVLRREGIVELARRREQSIADDLIRALEDGDSTVKRAAVRALGEIDSNAAVRPILDTMAACRTLSDGYGPALLGECIRALGQIGDPVAVPALLEELKKPNNLDLYNEVCLSLAGIGDPSALEPIEEHLARLRKHEPSESIAHTPWQQAVDTARISMEVISSRREGS